MIIKPNIASIKIEEYHYELPESRIAKYPLEKRDASKLLQWKSGQISDHWFTDLPNLLPVGTKLIFNNTKVIRARLFFLKETGARIEIFLLDPHEPADYAMNFQQTGSCSWKCLIGNQKKWKSGVLETTLQLDGLAIKLRAEITGQEANERIIRFSWDGNNKTFSEILDAAGRIPIPPYLQRESEEIDLTRYQTVFSKIKGSVAAPTAGLHFTDTIIENLHRKGITTAELTLHVGAGTFQPVKADAIGAHEMHTEHFVVSKTFIEEMLAHEGTIIAVGTTSVRTLESLYHLGNKIANHQIDNAQNMLIGQWCPYESQEWINKKDALISLHRFMEKNMLNELHAATQIIIVPGYQFRMINGMLTNFHQPQSTLLLLIAAILGEQWKEVYSHALSNNYRFLSYGDSNLYLI